MDLVLSEVSFPLTSTVFLSIGSHLSTAIVRNLLYYKHNSEFIQVETLLLNISMYQAQKLCYNLTDKKYGFLNRIGFLYEAVFKGIAPNPSAKTVMRSAVVVVQKVQPNWIVAMGGGTCTETMGFRRYH